MNGYFQIVNMVSNSEDLRLKEQEQGTYIMIYPPTTEKGLRVTTEAVQKYLAEIGITEFDLKGLHSVTTTCTKPTQVKLTPRLSAPINEKVEVTITIDRMKAFLKFYPASEKGRKLTKADVVESIRKANLKFGVVEAAVDKVLARHHYSTEYQIAQGKPPTQGKHAVITYAIDFTSSSNPKQNEDGSVDFHSLDVIKHVQSGDLLATLTPADFGKPGMDVCGGVLKPNKVENKVLRYGRDITISEDKTQIFSNVSGHAKLDQDGKVNVYNIYEVVADVDLNTGDIEFDGKILVKGSVRTGFKITATGDVEVHGPVEGAEIYAGGDIILQRGIQGMGRGFLQAGGNIIAKFIESSKIKAGGFIQSEVIMHSNVQAKTDIIVDGKKGMIAGGDIKAGNKINAKVIGSSMGTNTNIEVGIDPILAEAHAEATKIVQNAQKDLPQVEQMILIITKQLKSGKKLPPERMAHLQNALIKKKEIESLIQEYDPKIAEYEEELEKKSNGRVNVYGSVYPGVKMSIGNVKRFIQEEMKYSTFVRDGADIKSRAYHK